MSASVIRGQASALYLLTRIAENENLDPMLTFYGQRLLALRQPVQLREVRVSRQIQRSALEAAAGVNTLNKRERALLRLLAQALPNQRSPGPWCCPMKP